jgi:hypothetical protein
MPVAGHGVLLCRRREHIRSLSRPQPERMAADGPYMGSLNSNASGAAPKIDAV